MACFILAGIMFLASGANQHIFNQSEVDEIAWGLFFVVLAWVLEGVWRPGPWERRQ